MFQALLFVYLARVVDTLSVVLIILAICCLVIIAVVTARRILDCEPVSSVSTKKWAVAAAIVGFIWVMLPPANLMYAIATLKVTEIVAQTETSQQAIEWIKQTLKQQITEMANGKKSSRND